MNYIEQLEHMRACSQAIGWLKLYKYPDLRSAWYACENIGWMMWLQFMCSQPDSEERKAVLRVLIKLGHKIYDESTVLVALDIIDRLCKDKASYTETVDSLNRIRETPRGAGSTVSKLLLSVTDVPNVHMANWIASVCEEHNTQFKDTLNIIRQYFPNPPVLQ